MKWPNDGFSSVNMNQTSNYHEQKETRPLRSQAYSHMNVNQDLIQVQVSSPSNALSNKVLSNESINKHWWQCEHSNQGYVLVQIKYQEGNVTIEISVNKPFAKNIKVQESHVSKYTRNEKEFQNNTNLQNEHKWIKPIIRKQSWKQLDPKYRKK